MRSKRLPFRGAAGAIALAGAIVLSGTTFDATQLKTGIVGILDEQTAGRIGFGAGGQGALMFDFVGTGANIAMFQSASGQPADMVEVSVDGAAFVSAGAASGGVYTLCSGLANTTHTLVVRTNGAYGPSGNVRTTGTVLTIVGGTTVTLPRNNQAVTSGLGASIMKSANTFDTNTTGQRIPTGLQFPAKVVRGPQENGRRNSPSFRIRTNATKFWVYSENRFLWVNDGTTTTRYALTGNGSTTSFLTKLSGFSGLKNYSMWEDSNANMTIVPVDGDFFTIPETNTFDEYGDSVAECIAYGAFADYGEATVYKTAVGLGRIGSNFGVSGNTILNLKNRIDAILNNKEITSKDVAYLTIGRNNFDAPLDATEKADYKYITDALLAKSYGRILVRGILQEGVSPQVINADIEAIVAAYANPRIVYVDPAGWTTGWTTVERPDGVHLSVAGTNALNVIQLAQLPAYIGTL